MVITEHDVKDFQELYLKHFSLALNKNEARELLIILVKQEALAHINISRKQFDALINRTYRDKLGRVEP